MSFTFDKQYLSVFTDRIIPGFLKDRYPNYREFIKTFLEFLEEDPDGVYTKIQNLVKTKDLAYIQSLTDTTLQAQLLDALYISLFGESKATYLATVINDYAFLGNLTNINSKKGTQAGFHLMFLLVIGEFYRIYNILGFMKRHDGRFRYDGLIRYGNSDTWIEPFLYLIRSEFKPSDYIELMKLLNPAGMFPLTLQDATKRITIADTFSNAQYYGDVYAAIYLDTTLVKLIACTSYISTEVSSTDSFNIELSDFSYWNYDFTAPYQTGTSHVFYEANFNTSFFTGTYNKVHLLKDCIYSGSPASNVMYSVLPDSYTDFSGAITIKHSDNTNFEVVDYCTIGIMAAYS